MAIVETLEVRFVAKLGNLGAQISAITAALSGLGGASNAAMTAVSGASHQAQRALQGVGLSTGMAEKKQHKFAAKLKKTSRALKNVSSAAKKAAENIGLHKLDEVNLVGEEKKQISGSSGSGASSSGGGASSASDYEGLKRLKTLLTELDGFFARFYGNIRRSMQSVDGWINKATGGLAGKLVGLLGNAGKNAAGSLTNALLGALNLSEPILAANGRSLLQAIGDALRSGAAVSPAPAQAAVTLTDKLRNGILSGQSGVKNAAAAVTQAAKFGSESASAAAKNVGANLSQGLADGILSKLKKVRDAAARLANAALDKLRGLLRIASPSKVTFAMGGFFSEGFAGGIRASAYMAQNSAGMLARSTALQLNSGPASFSGTSDLQGMVRAAVNEALGSTDIVIPLNVDGIKLGEASIRGINRVTRASGRLMLEI